MERPLCFCVIRSSSHRCLAAGPVTDVAREGWLSQPEVLLLPLCALLALEDWCPAAASPANRAMCGCVLKGSSGDAANPFPVPSLPNGNSKPGKPQVKSDR